MDARMELLNGYLERLDRGESLALTEQKALVGCVMLVHLEQDKLNALVSAACGLSNDVIRYRTEVAIALNLEKRQERGDDSDDA